MGGIYKRGNKLWLWYFDATGKRVFEPALSNVGEETSALKTLQTIERRIEAEKRTGVPAGELTVKVYGERWLEGRPAQGIGTAADEAARLRLHAWPILGRVLLKELRPHHVRDMVRALKLKKSARGKPLAPRTIRHVYGHLHAMLHEAVVDELIASNPCALKRGELPAKIDRDPTWRSGAIFTREEVERLISDERIPEDRRLFYAIAFLAGLRTGEVSALRWRAYDPEVNPLGKLLVAASFNTRTRTEKAVKTGKPREVPVHPTLAKLIAAWKLSGWQRLIGRQPGPDDVLVPKADEQNRDAHFVLYRFRHDCELLGLRKRRQYDSRRTFISLAQANGARKDILRWVTHGPEGDIVSLYTTLPWAALCDEVVKLRVELREGRVLEFPKVAAVGCYSPCDSKTGNSKKLSALAALEAMNRVSPTGFEAARARIRRWSLIVSRQRFRVFPMNPTAPNALSRRKTVVM
jgi:integrase